MAHRFSVDELQTFLAAAETAVPKDTTWRHYRDNSGDHPYLITGHAVLEADESIHVLYQSTETKIVFSRPLTEFLELLRGGTQQRFQKIIT